MTRLLQLIVGLGFGLLSALALAPTVAAFRPSAAAVAEGARSGFGTMGLLALVIGLICAFAPSLTATLGRALLILGGSVLALPLSVLLASGRIMIDSGGLAPALGTALAGSLLGFLSGIVGLLVGGALLILGALVLLAAPRRR